jgi:hypothetical protein
MGQVHSLVTFLLVHIIMECGDEYRAVLDVVDKAST